MIFSPFKTASLFAILSGALYGTLGLFGVLLQESGLSIFQFLWGRFFIATLLILPILLYLKQPITWNRSSAAVFLSALLFYSSATCLFFYAVPLLGTGLAMVLFFTYPASVIIIESVMERKLPSLSTTFALLLVLAGLPLLIDKEAYEMSVEGIFLGLLSAALYAAYFYISQHYVANMSILTGTFWICLGNLVAYTIPLLLLDMTLPYLSGEMVLPLFGIAFLSTILPLYFIFKSLNYLNATQASLLSVAEPVVTVLLGYLFLAESINALQLTGTLLILASVLMLKQDKQKQRELV